MRLSELFKQLEYGELQNLPVGGKDCGGIYPKKSDEVVTYITQALTALHDRFALKQNELILQQYSHITSYHLIRANTESAGNTMPIIIDSVEDPFTEDLLRIEEVYDEGGCEVPINDEKCECSVYTPQFNVLQVPFPYNDQQMSVIYKANHAPIDLINHAPKDIEIDIPATMLRPLQLYVSSLAHTAVGSQDSMQTGFLKMQEYEALVLQLELNGTVQRETWRATDIRRNGWV